MTRADATYSHQSIESSAPRIARHYSTRAESFFLCAPAAMAAIALGVGHVTKMLVPIVAKAISKAVQKRNEKKAQKSGKGYHHAMTKALRRHKQTARASQLPYLTRAETSDDSDDDDEAVRGQGIPDGDMHDDDRRDYIRRMRQVAVQNEKERRRYEAYVASLEKKGSGLPTFSSGYGDDLYAHELHEFW